MATYILGSWTPNLQKLDTLPFLPIGVIVREGDELAMRLIGESRLPEEYRPTGEVSKAVWRQMGDIFREQEGYSNGPTNLYFTKHTLEYEGTLDEKTEKFFEQYVVPSLNRKPSALPPKPI
jgi:hypothetical protein